MLQRDTGGDAGPPVAALGDEPPISESAHQFRPRIRDAMDVPTCLGRRAAEPVSRQLGDDNMETAAGVISESRRVRKSLHAVLKLEERAWPAMRHDQWRRLRNGRAQVEEVDGQPVDRGRELWQPFEPSLRCYPVVRRR